MDKIGIVVATEEERESILSYLKDLNNFKIFDLNFYEGNFENKNIVIVESGIGKVNASRATQILIDNMKVDCIINIGVAAGLYEKLNTGDIVISKNLIQHDFDITAFNHPKGYISNVGDYIEADEYLIKLFYEEKTNNNVYIGTIASGDIFITDTNMSKKIKDKFNAYCVEMEGAAIAQTCHLSNIPFVVIRSISDTPNNKNNIDYDLFCKEAANNVSKILIRTISKII